MSAGSQRVARLSRICFHDSPDLGPRERSPAPWRLRRFEDTGFGARPGVFSGQSLPDFVIGSKCQVRGSQAMDPISPFG